MDTDINPSSAGQEPPFTDANDTNNYSNIRRQFQIRINRSDGGQININTNGAANTTRARVINTVRQRVNQHNTQNRNILPPLVPQPVLNQQINNDRSDDVLVDPNAINIPDLGFVNESEVELAERGAQSENRE